MKQDIKEILIYMAMFVSLCLFLYLTANGTV